MAVQTINYDNKVALNTNPDIANINKVTDNDMNEIKTVVNNNANETSTNSTNITNIINAEVYSTNEVKTNSIWIDGKPIYRKVIQMSNVAAGTTGTYDISNLNISNVWIDFGKSFYKSGALSLPLNRTHTGTTNNQSEARVSPTTISLICGSGISAENPVITINYTKTTD